MSRIFWDTNLFIYLFEGYGQFSLRVQSLRKRMLERGDQLLTSTLTLGELLVKPMDMRDAELCKKYEEAIAKSAIIVSFENKAAVQYARIRRDRTIRPPDAIQLACASVAQTDLFITNDGRLHSKRIDGIQFIVSLDAAPL
jgi:predicted nucleic acid-binding protein